MLAVLVTFFSLLELMEAEVSHKQLDIAAEIASLLLFGLVRFAWPVRHKTEDLPYSTFLLALTDNPARPFPDPSVSYSTASS